MVMPSPAHPGALAAQVLTSSYLPHLFTPALRDLRKEFYTKGSLKGANFKGSNLSSISLFGANLENADFTGADLSLSNLGQANLEGANLTQVRGVGGQGRGGEGAAVGMRGRIGKLVLHRAS